MDPFASTGLKKAMSTSYSLFSDLPVNLRVSSARTMEASFTSAEKTKMGEMLVDSALKDRC